MTAHVCGNLQTPFRSYAEIRVSPYVLVRGVVCPPMSVAIRSHLASWLSKWLQIEDLRELGQLAIQVLSETVTRIDFEVPEVD